MKDTGPILYFDGVCNLCNSVVQYVIRHDKSGKFRFASLQSEAGERAKAEYENRFGSVPDSLLLSHGGQWYAKSNAALRTAIIIGRGRWLAKLALLSPKFIRDFIYDIIAANRYRWFGRKARCMVPTPLLQARFLS